MSRWRKKPLVVDAVKISSIHEREASFFSADGDVDWLDTALAKDIGEEGAVWAINDGLRVGTLEGTMRADVGDYVVRGTHGEIYCVKGAIFEENYEPCSTT